MVSKLGRSSISVRYYRMCKLERAIYGQLDTIISPIEGITRDEVVEVEGTEEGANK